MLDHVGMKLPTPAPSSTVSRARIVRALAMVKDIVSNLPNDLCQEDEPLEARLRAEFRRSIQETQAFVLALVADEECPMKMFAAYASPRRIREWRSANKLTCTLKNGKLCCKPTEFFRHWRMLNDGIKCKAAGDFPNLITAPPT